MWHKKPREDSKVFTTHGKTKNQKKPPFSVYKYLITVFLFLDFFAIGAFAQAETNFQIFIKTDESISFWDPESSSADSQFEFEELEDGKYRHTIIIDQPLRFRDCSLDYRKSREVRVRWEPHEGFSERAHDYYEIVLTIIEPTDLERDSVEFHLNGPEGFTRSHLQEYEALRRGQGLESVRLFFPSAFLAQHFSVALPEGHGLTRRMANASVDHLATANKYLSNINLQPGFPFEEFTIATVAGESRGEKTITTLREMNVSFFRDIFVATRDMFSAEPEYGKCMRGLNTLRELSQCHDTIAISEPDLLADAMGVVSGNIQGVQDGFDFTSNIADGKQICESLRQD